MLSQRLQVLRKQKDVTQEELAKYLGVTRPAYSAYEAGKRTPDFNSVEKLATFFNVSVDYLLGRTDNPKGILDEPSDLEIEHILKNNQVMFNGDVMTEEEKEDVLNFIRHVLKRERSEQKK